MPGVDIDIIPSAGPSAPAPVVSGQAFFAGLTEFGPTDRAVRVRSFAEFMATFGTRQSNSYMYDTLRTFFSEGGSQAYVARTVGAAAVKASYTFVDRAAEPVATLKFEAASEGSWGNGLEITVVSGIGSAVIVTVNYGGVPVQTVTAESPAGIAAGFSNSQYVSVSNLGSQTAAPNNTPATGTHSLILGNADSISVNDEDYALALDLFVPELGDGFVSVPGVGDSVHEALILHAESNHRTACLTLGENASKGDYISAAAALDSEYAGMFGPWVSIIDGTTIRVIPPDGYIAGVRNRAHSQVGPWRAPAGQIASSRYLTGLVTSWGRADGDDLYNAKVNIIRSIGGSFRNYGWRSLSSDSENYYSLASQDTLNFLNTSFDRALEQFVFETVDAKGQLLSTISGTLVGILAPISEKGGLFARINADTGIEIDPGYVVTTDSTVNNLATLSANEVHAAVGVRLSPSAALIVVTLVKVGLISGLI